MGEILLVIPQGFILGPLPLNVFLHDLFFIMRETDFASHADGNTPYRPENTTNEVIQSLEQDSTMFLIWFSDNQMKANISICHILVNKADEVIISIGDTEIKKCEYENLLGIKVDSKLNFNEHSNDITIKVSRKVNVLSRVMTYTI